MDMHSRPAPLDNRDLSEILTLRRDRDGVDCYVLVAMVLRRMGCDWPLTAGAALAAMAEPDAAPLVVPLEASDILRPGDLVRVDPETDIGLPVHLAIMIGPDQVLHMSASGAPVVNTIHAYARLMRAKGRLCVLRPAALSGAIMGGIRVLAAGDSGDGHVRSCVLAQEVVCPR